MKQQYVCDLVKYLETGVYSLDMHPFSSHAATRNGIVDLFRGLDRIHCFSDDTGHISISLSDLLPFLTKYFHESDIEKIANFYI